MLKRKATIDKYERRAAPSTRKYKYRIQKPIGSKIYQFRRTLQQLLPINLSTGWSGGGYALLISPALSSCSFYINNTLAYQPVMPAVSDFQNLFDNYRIRKVNIQLFFSNNESNVSSPNTALPVVHIANDYNDANNFGLTEIQQYPNMATYQLGLEKPIKWTLYPKVRLDALTDSGVTSSSAFNTQGWLDTTSSNIMHLGTKMYLNTLGRTGNTDVGTVAVIVTYDMEFKNPR